jgi:hypothetical protein
VFHVRRRLVRAAIVAALCFSGVSTATAQSREQEDGDPPAWYERLRFSGDFRSRYEGFYQADRDTRHRTRLRFRLRLDADINDDARFQLRVSSGDSGNPVSTNQTFTGFFTPKPFNLERAFVAYSPQAASALTLGLGKYGLPLTRTQMIFDDDLNVEGGWEQVSWETQDGLGVNLVALQTAVNEVSAGDDSYMLGGYGEVNIPLGEHSLQVSVADYGWRNADQIAVGIATDKLNSNLTNQLVRDDVGTIVGFTSEFNVIDVIAEATIDTGDSDYPLRLLADFAHNTRAVSSRDSGFWLEVGYGDPDAPGTWGTVYTYGWVEQDVTPSAFVFSDIPGTNLRLHMLEASYIPAPHLSLDVTLHLTRQLFLEQPGQSNSWLSRLHTAVVVSF